MKKTKVKVETGKEESERLKEQLARVLADYDNLKKRVEREKEEYYRIVVARWVAGWLAIFDMFEQVQRHLNDSGLAIAMGELKEKLKEEGIEAIEPKAGEKFDEGMMEATEAVEREGAKEGEVLEVVLKGYKIGEMVLRHAKVVVGRKGEKNE